MRPYAKYASGKSESSTATQHTVKSVANQQLTRAKTFGCDGWGWRREGGLGGSGGAHVEHILVLAVAPAVSLALILFAFQRGESHSTHTQSVSEREVLGPASRDLSQVEG